MATLQINKKSFDKAVFQTETYFEVNNYNTWLVSSAENLQRAYNYLDELDDDGIVKGIDLYNIGDIINMLNHIRIEIADELIDCPIDGTNIIFEVFDDIFDGGEYVQKGNTYAGFVDGYPAFLTCRKNVINVKDVFIREDIYNKLVDILKKNDEAQPDSEYEHYVHHYPTSNNIVIYYRKK